MPRKTILGIGYLYPRPLLLFSTREALEEFHHNDCQISSIKWLLKKLKSEIGSLFESRSMKDEKIKWMRVTLLTNSKLTFYYKNIYYFTFSSMNDIILSHLSNNWHFNSDIYNITEVMLNIYNILISKFQTGTPEIRSFCHRINELINEAVIVSWTKIAQISKWTKRTIEYIVKQCIVGWTLCRPEKQFPNFFRRGRNVRKGQKRTDVVSLFYIMDSPI